MRRVRGRDLAMILQDPMASLNPALTIGEQVAEPLRLHQGLRGAAVREASIAALKRMRIAWPEQRWRSTRTISAAACVSVWPAPSPWPASRRCSSPTSRPPR